MKTNRRAEVGVPLDYVERCEHEPAADVVELDCVEDLVGDEEIEPMIDLDEGQTGIRHGPRVYRPAEPCL